MENVNLYKVLELSKEASQDEILRYAFGSGGGTLLVADSHPCGEDN